MKKILEMEISNKKAKNDYVRLQAYTWVNSYLLKEFFTNSEV